MKRSVTEKKLTALNVFLLFFVGYMQHIRVKFLTLNKKRFYR